MKNDLMFVGVGMVAMSPLLAMSIMQWSVGSEFWPFVPAFLLVGVICVYASWEQA
jgi:hypothetical protein